MSWMPWIDCFGLSRRGRRGRLFTAIGTGLLVVMVSGVGAAGQSLEVVPDADTVVTFTGLEGGPFQADLPAAWTLEVGDNRASTGSAAGLDFSVFSSESWLIVTPASGVLSEVVGPGRPVQVEAMLDLSAARALPAGVYSASIKFTNLTAGSGDTTRLVILSVTPASFSVSPAFVNAAATLNGADPSPVTVTLTGSGRRALDYELSWAQRSWFTVDAVGGTVPAGGSDSFAVRFNLFGLSQGVYTSNVTIKNTTNGAGSRELPITLVVYPAAAGVVMLSPSADIEVRGRAEGVPTSLQVSTLSNTSDEAVPWSAVASEEWVSVTPSAGELAASDGVSGGADAQAVEIRLNAARNDLPAGSHTATVTFKQTNVNAVTGDMAGVAFGTRVVRVIADPVLTVSVPLEGGQVTASPSGAVILEETQSDLVFGFGDVVTLTVVLEDGFQFDGWVADFELEAELENPLVVTMDRSKSVGAVTVPIPRTLTLSTSGDGTGTVAASPTGSFIDNALVSRYNNGAEVEITATPDAGSAFGGWAGNVPEGMETANPLAVVMDRERTITARFVPGVTLTVEVVGEGEGEVTVEPDLETYAAGAVITLTAAPGEGSVFAGWGGDGEGSEPTLTLTLSEDAVVEAAFAIEGGDDEAPPDDDGTPPDDDENPNVATLTVDIEGDGVVTPGGGEYALGARVTLIATPGIGSSFTGWEEDATGTDLTTTITMDGDRTVRAVFELSEEPATQPEPTVPGGAGQLCGAMGLLGMPMLLLGFATLTRFRGSGGHHLRRARSGEDSGVRP